MKRRIIAIVISIVLMAGVLAGCKVKGSGVEQSIKKLNNSKSYEAETTVELNLDPDTVPGINDTAYKLLSIASKGPFIIRTKKVNASDLSGQITMNFESTVLDRNDESIGIFNVYIDYDLKDANASKFEIVIPTTNFDRYFAKAPEAEYLKYDLAKSESLRQYMPLITSLQKKYKFLNNIYPLDTFLGRAAWSDSDTGAKTTIYDEQFKEIMTTLIKEIFDESDALTLMQAAGYGNSNSAEQVRERFYNMYQGLVNVQVLGNNGLAYNIVGGNGAISEISLDGQYAINPRRILRALGAKIQLPSDTVNFTMKAVTKFSGRNSTKIKTEYTLTDQNCKDMTSKFDDYLYEVETGEKREQDPITIYMNGRRMNFQDSETPRMVDWKTMVPAKPIIEVMGSTMSISSETITYQGKTSAIQLTIGSSEALVDGALVPLDAPPTLIDGNVFVPLRFLADSLGLTLELGGSDGFVNIYLSSF